MDDAQTIIAKVGATIASSLTIDEVLSAIARQVCEAFGVASADIHRYSADTDLLDYVASWGVAEGFTEEGAGVGESYPPEMRLNYVPVVRERRIVEVHRDDPDLPPAEAAEMDRWGEMSNLDGPLEFGGQVIGVLGIVESRNCRRFTEAEKLLFSQLAVLAAIAIHNADVFSVLEHLVITDGLTDLFNHRHFYDRLTQEAVRAARYELPFSLLMIDIDDFKRYNDQFGHRAGDAVLRDLAVLLKQHTRQQIDVVARYGGEEFAVILPSTGTQSAAKVGERLRRSIVEGSLTGDQGAGLSAADGPSAADGASAADGPSTADGASAADGTAGGPSAVSGPGAADDGADDGGPGAALSAAERIRSAIADEVFGPPDSPARITVSVGVASFPLHASSMDDLVDAADRAVYRAKEQGKNRVEMAGELTAP